MRNRCAFALGATAVALMATVVVSKQHLQNSRLRQRVAALQVQPLPSEQPIEHQVVSTQVPHTSDPTIPATSEPSAELLRLRGEVARLRFEKEKWLQEKDQLQRDLLLTRGSPPLPLLELYQARGLDTNTIPNIPFGSGSTDVVSELQRVGASVIEDEGSFIHAVVPALGATNNLPVLMDIAVYFDGSGRVTSQVWRKADL